MQRMDQKTEKESKQASERKMLQKRLGIFLGLTFSFTWGMIFLSRLLFPDPDDAAVRTGFFNIMGMTGPALGHLFTRLLTREGWQGTYLNIGNMDCRPGDLRKEGRRCQKIWRKGVYYHLAVWGQLAMILAAVWLLCLYEKTPFRLQYSAVHSAGMLLFNTAVGFAGLLVYFGEEWGWRGYLFPKLEQLTGTASALFLTGIIWGLWHLPLLLEGLNFGKDLPGYPVSNVLLMCVYCIPMGSFLTWLTKRSGSVWPATLAHMLTDHAADVLMVLFLPENILRQADAAGMFLCNLAVMFLVAVPVWRGLLQKREF